MAGGDVAGDVGRLLVVAVADTVSSSSEVRAVSRTLRTYPAVP
ncbi:hypothetical protein FHX81_7335 [Saccharothrix saharensis]|uniref:Uncharacterized protein n=1 Tax=Saccharothrix saharensis TaxID=571190 RepID=A0A543JQ47_9PSEU|nr:hypothetical protein FHX81_7335 [Saccharothrix saharensis]